MTDDATFLEYLKKYHTGETNAVLSHVLGTAFSLSNREIRHIVSSLRRENEPICSSDKGYFYSSSRTEIQRCINQLNHRQNEIYKVKHGLEMALKKIELEEDYHGISLFTE